jgi:hypothetical protein
MNESWLLPQLAQHGAALLGTALVLNSIFTFLGAMGFALLAAKVAGSPRVAKLILLTPWIRVVWDVIGGASPNAYVLSEYAGTKGALGTFQLGVGSAAFVPVVQASVGMQGGAHRYDYSVGDMLAHGLFRQLGPEPLLVTLTLLLLVSSALLLQRGRHFLGWRLQLGRDGAEALQVESIALPLRQARIVTRPGAFGAFTSGVLFPRIWLSAELSGARRRAVLEHELAHARDADVLWFGLAGILTDLFWFVPGARFLERRLHDRAEQAADRRALARGVDPRALADSILDQASSALAIGPAPRMAGAASRLEQRLLALATWREPRRWQLGLRLVVAALLTASVFRSAFGGYS